jgi:hypothetical protein
VCCIKPIFSIRQLAASALRHATSSPSKELIILKNLAAMPHAMHVGHSEGKIRNEDLKKHAR